MKWTSEPPNKSGFYWLKLCGYYDAEVVEVVIKPHYPYALFYECGSNAPNYNSNTGNLWAGPIEEPKE